MAFVMALERGLIEPGEAAFARRDSVKGIVAAAFGLLAAARPRPLSGGKGFGG